MTPTNAPGFVTAPTWNGRGITHITGHIVIADGDRILLNRYDIRELLIEADDRLTALALDLDRRMPEGWTRTPTSPHWRTRSTGSPRPRDMTIPRT